MYRPNDVLIEGHRLSNLFNSQDEDWHNQNIRPIRGLWSMTKVLEYEPLIDETLNKFVNKLAAKFVDGANVGTVCPADEWIGFCKTGLWCMKRKTFADVFKLPGMSLPTSASAVTMALLTRKRMSTTSLRTLLMA
jgi:hypothetical protein